MNTEFEKINISEELDSVVSTSMGKLRQERRREKIRHAAAGIGGTALMLGAAFIFCVNNTAFASKLPLIGHVFERMEERSDYPTGLKDNSVQLIDDNEAQELDKLIEKENIKNTDGSFVKTSNGITIMISEFTYDRNSIYMGVTIKNDEPFPEGFKHSKYIEGYQLSYERPGIYGIAELRDENGNKMDELEEYCVAIAPEEVRGTFIDDYTFSGIMRADFSGIKTPEDMPDDFTYNLKISRIYYDDCLETHKAVYTGPDGDVEWDEWDLVEYEGDWNFDIDISYSGDKIKTVTIDESNEAGEGIASVSKTPYVITVKPIIPENRKRWDYFCVVCDAQGDLLDSVGSAAETYDITHLGDTRRIGSNGDSRGGGAYDVTRPDDTNEFYVFLCDSDRYLDELKGYYWSDDYEEKKKTKTFAEYLQENCLYGTKVEFGEE